MPDSASLPHRLYTTLAKYAPFATLYALFASCVTYPILRSLRLACYPYYDVGIYGQAVDRLSRGEFNPWLTGRQIRIFNDHFDPIIWLSVPLVRWLGAARAFVLTESFLVAAATLPILYLWQTNRLDKRNALVAVAILLFHPSVALALAWPAHPTTWAVAPAVFLGTALLLKCDRAAYVSFLVLLCCKEEFVYVGFALSIWLVCARRTRLAIYVAGTSAIWMTWVFVGRAYVFGPTMAYTKQFTDDIWVEPTKALMARFAAPNLPFDVASAGAFLLIFGLVARAARQQPMWGALGLCLPLLGIRFISKMWGFHYSAIIAAFCVVAFLPGPHAS